MVFISTHVRRLAACFVAPAVALTLSVLPPVATPAGAQQALHLPGSEEWIQKQWTVDDGLPQNSVNDIVQDQTGFLWLATYDGLARFDGTVFTTFRSATAPGTLPSDRVTTLALAPDGLLWIGTEGGVAVWDGYRFFAMTGENGLPDNFVNDISVGSDGTVWVSTQGPAPGSIVRLVRPGLSHADGTVSADVDTLSGGPRGPSTPAERLLTMDGSVGWSLGREAVHRLPGGVTYRLVNPERDALKGLFVSGNGMLVAASEFGRLFTRNTSGDFEEYDRMEELSQLQAWAVTPGVSENSASPRGIWAGSVGAIHFLAEGGQDAEGARRQVTVSLKGAETATVRSILPTENGHIWVGTNGRGLIHLRPALFDVFNAARGLEQEVALSVTEDADGTVWVGTNCGGVYRVDHTEVARPVVSPLVPRNACVYSVLGARNGDIWIGHEYLVRYRNGTFTRFGPEAGLTPNESRRSDFILALYEDPDAQGTFWVGTQQGLQRFDGYRFYEVIGSENLLHPHVRSFLRDTSGRLWIATRTGVNILDGDSMTSLTLADGLPSLDVRAFLELPSGDMLIGTYGGGLAVWQGPGDVSVITERDGLFENVISSLVTAEDNLWTSGNRGISRVPLDDIRAFLNDETKKVRAIGYQQESGLTIPETNGGFQPAMWKAADESLWYPTLGGVARVEPRRAVVPPPPPRVWIDIPKDVSIHDRILILDERVRDIELPYVGIDLIAPERVTYRYRLDSFSDEWVNAETRRQAIFTNVPPGSYTFRVEASGLAGTWSTEAATLDIVVVPRFYEHWFFRLGLLIILVALAALAARTWSRSRSEAAARRERELNRIVARRTRDLEAAVETITTQTEQLKELDKAKTRFFANTSHEFRTPLSLILAPVQKLLDGAYGSIAQRLGPAAERDLKTVMKNAERLRELTGQLLDLARMEVGNMAVEPEWVDIASLVSSRAGMFHSAAEERNIRLTCTSERDTLPFCCDEKVLETILINLVSNAIDRAPDGGAVTIAPEITEEGTLSVMVESSRTRLQEVKRDESEKSDRELRLTIAQEYAALHAGHITVANTEHGGTRYTVFIPPSHPESEQPPRRSAALTGATEDIDDDEGVGTRILVVEDHDDLRRFIAESLGDYEVIESNNAMDGLEMARTHTPDAILSDVMMPGMDGIALCREIRADRRTNHIPVILLTARVDKETRMEGLEAGADDYIEKPFRTAELRIRMENILRRREELQAWFRESVSMEHAVHHRADDDEPVRDEDRAFVHEVNRIVTEELENAQFGVDALADRMSLSRRQLTRKMKALLGQSPGFLIRTRRMEHARLLLTEGGHTAAAVARRVGYASASHFSKAFQDHFGEFPSDIPN